MKILVYTAMNKRHKVSELFLIGMKRFFAAAPEGIECDLMAVYTEPESAELIDKFGFRYVHAENDHLGRKWNIGLQHALRNYNFDYIGITGDDDLFSDECWTHYKKAIDAKLQHIGFDQLFFYEPASERAVTFQYKKGYPKPVGCGRLISRRALTAASWKQRVRVKTKIKHDGFNCTAGMSYELPVHIAEYLEGMGKGVIKTKPKVSLWDDYQKTSLDGTSTRNLAFAGFAPTILDTDKPLMLDIKTGNNVWSLDALAEFSTETTVDNAINFLSQVEKDFIHKHFKTNQ